LLWLGYTCQNQLSEPFRNAHHIPSHFFQDHWFSCLGRRVSRIQHHFGVALAGDCGADGGWGAGRSAEREVGGEVAAVVDVCANGGDGDFLECAGFVEGGVRGFYPVRNQIVV